MPKLTLEEKQILSAAATIRATRMWAKRSKKDRVAHAKMMNRARNAKKVDKTGAKQAVDNSLAIR